MLLMGMIPSPFLKPGCAVFANKHALALAHRQQGRQVQGEGYLPPLERSGSGTEMAAEGRSAQAQRGRLGTLLVARQGRSPSGRLGFSLIDRPLSAEEAGYVSSVVRRITSILLLGPSLDENYGAILATATGLPSSASKSPLAVVPKKSLSLF